MRILLTNDDGIRAPGILAMYEAITDHARKFGGPLDLPAAAQRGITLRSPRSTVFTVAPLTVQSATGHGLTFHTPLMVRPTEVELSGEGRMKGLSVDGRPADCVKLAIANLWPDTFGDGSLPDLCISGMNDGANVGINVLYSGTVAAALEAAFLGVPSIAVSMTRGTGKADYAVGAAWCRAGVEAVLRAGLPRPHECITINAPATDGTGPDVNGPTPPIRVCAMNTHGLVDKFEKRTSPLGETYYWAAGHGLDFKGTDDGSDVDCLRRGCITVTPLMYDLTRHDTLEAWRARIERAPSASSGSDAPRGA
jgi:5'-nucleotidase